MKIHLKTFVVTGAGSGLGRALTLQLLERGARVAAIDIHSDALAETQALARVGDDQFRAFVLDITDKTKVDALPGMVLDHFGGVDGLINNAGIIQQFTSVIYLTMEEINSVVNVNFYGTVYMTKAFLPWLLKRPEAHLVNVSSMGGFIPFPNQTIYGASKAAVKLFTEGLYAELQDTSVRVTVVHPGAIATNIMENSGLNQQQDKEQVNSPKLLTAPKAARIIIRAMERNKYRITVGRDAALLDFLYRLYPKWATRFIGKMTMKKTGRNKPEVMNT